MFLKINQSTIVVICTIIRDVIAECSTSPYSHSWGPPASPLALWDLSLSLLPGIEMEAMFPRLPSAEVLPPPIVPVIELSSSTTPMMMDSSPPYPKYHPSTTPTYKEDPFEELSTAASCPPRDTRPSHARRVGVLSRQPRIIHTLFIPRRRGARGRSRLESRHS